MYVSVLAFAREHLLVTSLDAALVWATPGLLCCVASLVPVSLYVGVRMQLSLGLPDHAGSKHGRLGCVHPRWSRR